MFNLIKSLGGKPTEKPSDDASNDSKTNGLGDTDAGLNGITEVPNDVNHCATKSEKDPALPKSEVHDDEKNDASGLQKAISPSSENFVKQPEITLNDADDERAPSPSIAMQARKEASDSEDDNDEPQKPIHDQLPPEKRGLETPPPSEMTRDSTASQKSDDACSEDNGNEFEEAENKERILSNEVDDYELSEEELDPKNPAYVPRDTRYYMHDIREDMNQPANTADVYAAADKVAGEATTQEEGAVDANTNAEREAIRARKARSDVDKWSHDLYDEQQQTPKSSAELVKKYGFNIREHELNEIVNVPLKREPSKERFSSRRPPRQIGGQARKPKSDKGRRQHSLSSHEQQERREQRDRNYQQQNQEPIGDSQQSTRQQRRTNKKPLRVIKTYPRGKPTNGLRNSINKSKKTNDEPQHNDNRADSVQRPPQKRRSQPRQPKANHDDERNYDRPSQTRGRYRGRRGGRGVSHHIDDQYLDIEHQNDYDYEENNDRWTRPSPRGGHGRGRARGNLYNRPPRQYQSRSFEESDDFDAYDYHRPTPRGGYRGRYNDGQDFRGRGNQNYRRGGQRFFTNAQYQQRRGSNGRGGTRGRGNYRRDYDEGERHPSQNNRDASRSDAQESGNQRQISPPSNQQRAVTKRYSAQQRPQAPVAYQDEYPALPSAPVPAMNQEQYYHQQKTTTQNQIFDLSRPPPIYNQYQQQQHPTPPPHPKQPTDAVYFDTFQQQSVSQSEGYQPRRTKKIIPIVKPE